MFVIISAILRNHMSRISGYDLSKFYPSSNYLNKYKKLINKFKIQKKYIFNQCLQTVIKIFLDLHEL